MVRQNRKILEENLLHQVIRFQLKCQLKSWSVLVESICAASSLHLEVDYFVHLVNKHIQSVSLQDDIRRKMGPREKTMSSPPQMAMDSSPVYDEKCSFVNDKNKFDIGILNSSTNNTRVGSNGLHVKQGGEPPASGLYTDRETIWYGPQGNL